MWAQGNTNTSHGCLNLNGDNAQWFYNFSVPGDVVEVRNTGGPPLQLWQNGDWSVPWSSGARAAPCPDRDHHRVEHQKALRRNNFR